MADHETLLDSFYEEVSKTTYDCNDLDQMGKSVVLFRVAIENGAAAAGILGILHVMSKILTSTLAMAEEGDVFEEFLKNFDPDDSTKH